MYQVKAPENKAEFQRYYHFRWQMLRAPWQQAQGTEQDELEADAIHRMIVDDAGEIIAVGRLHKTSQSQAQIRYMAVADNHQGKGLGRLIIEALELEAAKQGVTEINLNARAIALAFYLQLGYQQVAKSHLLYGEIQHFLMRKSLVNDSQPLLADHQALLCQRLIDTWHSTIPMSKAMNMQVNYYNGQTCYTSCDLAFNKNLHNTMFAGSIYTLATLTGWGWVYMQLATQQLSGDIVLADATIKYLSPVGGAGVGFTCQEFFDGDLSELTNKGKARVNLTVEIKCGDKVAARFSGKYVVLASKNENE